VKSRFKSTEIQIVVLIAIFATLAATPFINKDALIIPKVIILCSGALYLLPKLTLKLHFLKNNKVQSILLILSTLFFLQLLIVMAFSNTPLEQQIFGRTGRGMGFATWFSCLIILLLSALSTQIGNIHHIHFGLTLTGVVTAVYAICQSFGFDFFPWDSKTNGVISTLGNPNFVSGFIAMSFIPSLIYFEFKKYKVYIKVILIVLYCIALYRADSLQGYIGITLSVITYLLAYLWYKNKSLFISLFVLSISGLVAVVLGSLNKGPLSSFFYKVSVQSRGDFWRSAINTSNDHKLFGVGLDSFGDYYLKYRDIVAVNHPWAEFTDSAHNYFLDLLVSGGYPLLIIYICIHLLTLWSLLRAFRTNTQFKPLLVSLFTAYLVFQAQALISPISIPILIWSSIISGSIIGVYSSTFNKTNVETNSVSPATARLQKTSIGLLVVSLVVLYPVFNVDRLQFNAMKNGDGDLAVSSTKKFPESVVRYSIMTRELLKSGLNVQALDLARSAVKFNPNSPALWVLIMVNPTAPIEERILAKQKMQQLDPLNQDIVNFEITK
jgi:O-antigen ligase